MYNSNLEIMNVNQYLLDNKEKINTEIGEKMKQVRKKKHITIEEIAVRSVTSPSYINQIERGRFGVSLAKFLLLCNALEVTPNEILEEFISGGRMNDDILYNKLQEGKNLSENILDFMKEKKKEF